MEVRHQVFEISTRLGTPGAIATSSPSSPSRERLRPDDLPDAWLKAVAATVDEDALAGSLPIGARTFGKRWRSRSVEPSPGTNLRRVALPQKTLIDEFRRSCADR